MRPQQHFNVTANRRLMSVTVCGVCNKNVVTMHCGNKWVEHRQNQLAFVSWRANTMDQDHLIALGVWIRNRYHRRNQYNRSVWVHALNSERLSVGQYHTIMHQLRQDTGTKFFDYFRMSQSTFDELLSIMTPHIKKQDTHFRSSISAEERLAITLR